MPTANYVLSSTVWCNKALPLPPVYGIVSQVIEEVFVIKP